MIKASNTLDEIFALVSKQTGIKAVTAFMAIDQDLDLVGDDVVEFVETLANRFGEWVWEWPWHRFACLGEGLSIFFPLMVLWQLITWPFRGTFNYPSSYERLELQHIAKMIDAGKWIEP